MSRSKNTYNPDYSVAPGEILLDALVERGLTQSDLAQRTGRPIKTINEIIQGKTAITPETALQLERVLDIPSKFWMNLETNYQSFIAREKERDRLESWTEWLKEVPVAPMVKEGWISKLPDPISQLQAVLNFYGVASPEVWKKQCLSQKISYRASETFAKEPEATSAWLRRGEILAQKVECEPFDAKQFRESLLDIRELTVKSAGDFRNELVKLCASSGVAVVFVPGLPKAPISGASRWLTPQKALIQLSLRHGTDDHFWFTFFHEAGHILLHGKREVFIDDDTSEAADSKEFEANEFASDILMPPKLLSQFVAARKFDKDSVLTFAEELGISPGIVVGKLQRHKLIESNRLNGLKRQVSQKDK